VEPFLKHADTTISEEDGELQKLHYETNVRRLPYSFVASLVRSMQFQLRRSSFKTWVVISISPSCLHSLSYIIYISTWL